MKTFVVLLCCTVLFAASVSASGLASDMLNAADMPRVESDMTGARVGLKTDDEVVEREEEAQVVDGFSAAERKVIEDAAETHEFQAEVHRLMDIIINSLYSNKEIFLRELISNASDALDKIRFEAIQNPSILEGEGDVSKTEIKIEFDKEAKTVSIIDTGIGMTKADLVNNLGTIAKSGTSKFLEQLSQGGDISLIGQFGVGFYSAFLVADKVTVTTKNNDDDQYVWESSADSNFLVAKDPRGNTMARGTRVTLHLKDNATDFLDQDKLKGLVQKYSEFINFPISLRVEKEIEVEEEPEPKEEKEDDEKKDDEELDIDDEEDEDTEEKKKVKKKVWEWEIINETKPIWTRPKEEITDEEYTKFYKSLSKDYADPVAHAHFSAEGEVEFKSLLYVPSRAPYDLFDNYYDKASNIKLYCRRVLITDSPEGIMPKYLSFVKGVVDSDDLPLNVSREVLQQSKVMKVIKKKLVRKTIDMIRQMAEDTDNAEKYEDFWKQFGKALKLGVIEDTTNRSKLSKLLRFETSKSEGKLIPLQEYVDRMKEKQSYIYYVSGESVDQVSKSPFVEKLIKRDYEVIYMVEAVDEYLLQSLTEFDNKRLMSASKEGLKFEETAEEKARFSKFEKMYKKMCGLLKDFLPKANKVTVSNRITNAPAVVVTDKYGWSANYQRIMKAQAFSTKEMMEAAITLEINPFHPIIRKIYDDTKSLGSADEIKSDKALADLILTVFDTALLQSGFNIEETSTFAERMVNMLNANLNIDPNAPTEDDGSFEPEEPAEEPSSDDGDDDETSGDDEEVDIDEDDDEVEVEEDKSEL